MKEAILLVVCLVTISTICFAAGTKSQTRVLLAAIPLFQGYWLSKDPYCQLELTQKGNKITGTYDTSPFKDGRRVQSGNLVGTVNGNHAIVKYTSSFADEKARGEIRLSLVNKELRWTLTRPANTDEEYTSDKVTLKRAVKPKESDLNSAKSGSYSESGPSVEDLVREAEINIEEGECKEADALIDEALSLKPDNVDALNDKLKLAEMEGDHKKSLQVATRLIALDPKNWRFWFNRGRTYSLIARPEKAIADYDQSIKLNPKFAMTWSNRGGDKFASGNLDGAIADLKQAIKVDPKFPESYNNLGLVYFRQKKLGEALQQFEKAITIDSNYARCLVNRDG